MELEIRNEGVKCDHNQTLPGWSKTGRRTRAARLHPPPERPLGSYETASRDEARDHLSDDLECGELAREDLPPKKRKVGSVTMNDGREGERKQQQQHKCNICSRSFSSYQALGGHKAHHSTKDAAHDQPPKGGGAAAVHRCTFCYKVFSKGQALGGHRRHCQRPAVSENKAKIFSFDLNEHPPEWLGS